MKYPQASDLVEGLRDIVLAIRPGADVELIERAYRVAAYRHQGQKRLSGHPLHHPSGDGRDDPGRARRR